MGFNEEMREEDDRKRSKIETKERDNSQKSIKVEGEGNGRKNIMNLYCVLRKPSTKLSPQDSNR